jgi:hypothetical protein
MLLAKPDAKSNLIEWCKKRFGITRRLYSARQLERKLMSSEATQFKPGRPKTGGRRKGTRDRISTALLEVIAKDFEEHGDEAVRIARIERPVEYLRVVASLLPKEFEITDNRLKDISDDELDLLLEYTRQRIARGLAASADGGKDQALN